LACDLKQFTKSTIPYNVTVVSILDRFEKSAIALYLDFLHEASTQLFCKRHPSPICHSAHTTSDCSAGRSYRETKIKHLVSSSAARSSSSGQATSITVPHRKHCFFFLGSTAINVRE